MINWIIHALTSTLDWIVTHYVFACLTLVLSAFFTGVFKKAGEDAYSWGKKNWIKPEFFEVHRHFETDDSSVNSYAWVGEDKLMTYVLEGWTHYKHPIAKGKVFRNSMTAPVKKEYLMRRP